MQAAREMKNNLINGYFHSDIREDFQIHKITFSEFGPYCVVNYLQDMFMGRIFAWMQSRCVHPDWAREKFPTGTIWCRECAKNLQR